jgi:hypothetical protein
MKSQAIAIFMAAAGLSVSAAVCAEPLADFEAMVAQCQQAFDQRPRSEVAYAEAASSWVKRQYAPASVAFKVLQTSSKVSPFVGQIEVTEIASALRGEDEESARALIVAMDENVVRLVRRVNFAYQDDAWVALGGTVRTELKRDAEDRFSVADSIKLSREAILELKGPMSVCVNVSRH